MPIVWQADITYLLHIFQDLAREFSRLEGYEQKNKPCCYAYRRP
jgi:hypothetical protein